VDDRPGPDPALIIFAMLVGGIGVAAALIFKDEPGPSRATDTVTPPAPAPQLPVPAEFSVGVVVTEQSCTGAGHCAYKYTIEPKYVGLHPLPEKEFTVVYQVAGGHEPRVGNFTVRNGQARIQKDVSLEGPPDARLQAAVTDVVG
jgi:hypothetical protein